MNTDEKDFVEVARLLNIELGGGNSPLYHPNIDIEASKGVDIVHDLSKGIPLPPNYADLIYSCDFIEHLPFLDFLYLLNECNRVLKIDGKIEFIVPDIRKVLFTHTSWNEHTHHLVVGDDAVYRSNNWEGGNPYLRHQMWYTPELVTYILEKEGDWRDISVTDYEKDADWWKEPKMRVVATKP